MRAFGKAVELDPDRASAHLGIAVAHLRLRRNADAAREALTAVGLQHFLPLGHLNLGKRVDAAGASGTVPRRPSRCR